jgi:hypothetical protein
VHLPILFALANEPTGKLFAIQYHLLDLAMAWPWKFAISALALA